MSSALHPTTSRLRPPVTLRSRHAVADAPISKKAGLGFALFIALNGILFIRPAEIVSGWEGLPNYEDLILACLAVSLAAIQQQLRGKALASQPINLCVLGMLAAVSLSHLHISLQTAWEVNVPVLKVMVYYVLLVSLMTSFSRLQRFMHWLAWFILVVAILALAQYHGVINVSSLETYNQTMAGTDETGESATLQRLCSSGIFHDPNELGVIIVLGMVICLYRLGDGGPGLTRWFWIAPMGVFGHGLMMTHSRGGFLALLAGVMVLMQYRFGWRKAIPLLAVALPVMFLLFGGRQTEMDLANPEDTAMGRIYAWKDGLSLWKSAPIFGIGKDEYAQQLGYVAHNSFVQSYVELGLFGGTIFTGAFFLAVWSLHRVRTAPAGLIEPNVLRLQPYLMAALAGAIIGMFSLSRSYGLPTYMLLGMVASYLSLPQVSRRVSLPTFTPRLLVRLGVVSMCTFAALYLFVRIMAR